MLKQVYDLGNVYASGGCSIFGSVILSSADTGLSALQSSSLTLCHVHRPFLSVSAYLFYLTRVYQALSYKTGTKQTQNGYSRHKILY